jgi:hypothetical protein
MKQNNLLALREQAIKYFEKYLKNPESIQKDQQAYFKYVHETTEMKVVLGYIYYDWLQEYHQTARITEPNEKASALNPADQFIHGLQVGAGSVSGAVGMYVGSLIFPNNMEKQIAFGKLISTAGDLGGEFVGMAHKSMEHKGMFSPEVKFKNPEAKAIYEKLISDKPAKDQDMKSMNYKDLKVKVEQKDKDIKELHKMDLSDKPGMKDKLLQKDKDIKGLNKKDLSDKSIVKDKDIKGLDKKDLSDKFSGKDKDVKHLDQKQTESHNTPEDHNSTPDMGHY